MIDKQQQTTPQRLFGVRPSSSEYAYEDLLHFSKIYSREYQAFKNDPSGQSSEFLILTQIDERTLSADISTTASDWDASRLLYKSYRDYIPSLRLVLIKMVTAAHEQAHIALSDTIKRNLAPMGGLDRELLSMGQVEIESNGRRKSADQSYRPRQLPSGRSDHWPSVVIEVAFSESRSKLANDARWWLCDSAGDVRAAITIAVHTTRREIVLERWGLIGREMRSDSSKQVPEAIQRLTISQDTTAQLPIRMTSDTFVIPFHHLFLRPAGPGEGDVVLNAYDLRSVAELTWEAHHRV